MTKLEEKLIQLGYEFIIDVEIDSIYINSIWEKWFFWKPHKDYPITYQFKLRIFLKKDDNRTFDYYIHTDCVREQYQITALQQAFNQLQNDLEVLKEYE